MPLIDPTIAPTSNARVTAIGTGTPVCIVTPTVKAPRASTDPTESINPPDNDYKSHSGCHDCYL